jgi:hypothetical protein
MITLNNGISGISSILGALTGTQETNDTETATSLKTQYKTAAQDLVSEYGSGNELDAKALKSSSLLNGFSVANKAKLTNHLGTLSLSEIADLLRRADGNRNGEVTATERRQYLQTLIGYIEDGKSAGEIQALNNARFLKNGGTVSDATKEKWLAQFEEYNIAKSAYTPTEGDTDTAEGLAKYKPLIEAGVPLLQGLLGSKANTPTGTPDFAQQAQVAMLQRQLALQSAVRSAASPTPSFAEMAGLAGLTSARGLDGMPFNAFGFSSQVLPTNPFGGASTLNTLLAGSAGLPTAFNPLTAGSNNLNLLPQQPFAQSNFVPSVPVAPSGFAFSPAASPVATAGTAPALPTPVVATTPAVNPAVTSWAPPTPTLLAQALPQAPAPNTANGGW